MKIFNGVAAGAMSLAVSMFCTVQSVQAETLLNLVRETLRQQSTAARSSCAGVQQTVAAGRDATLVVRTAIELGYNSCDVIRCALEGKAASVPDKEAFCEKVIRGAVAAGVQADVISRCSSDNCDPAAVAAILAATLEPNYCYFFPRPLVAPAPLPPAEPVFDRSLPQAQASPFTF